MFAFPVTCTNDSVHFAPSRGGVHWGSGLTEPADLHEEATLPSSSRPRSPCTIHTALMNDGGQGREKSPAGKGMKAFSF